MTKQSDMPDLGSVVERMREKYPNTPDQLIPLLQFVQSEMGYLPMESMNYIAEYLRVPASHVYGVATFYAQFRFSPLGKNRITVCRGTACHVRGGKKIIEEISKTLGVQDGETTEDLSFSLETVACVGSCALAPVVVVNDRVHGKVTPKKMRNIIYELQGRKIEDLEEAVEEAPEEKKKEKPAPVKKAPKKAEQKPAAKEAAEDVKKAAPKKAVKKAAKKAAKKAVKKVVKKKAAKKAAKKTAKKAAAKKAVKKASAKKAVKKAAKKAAPKKAAKKAAKKAVKKAAAKKPAGKAVKKAAAKKAVKKAAKKAVKKTAKRRSR